MASRCELRHRFRACGEESSGVCQYCGRSFCARHGGRLEDGQEICARAACQRKKADLERHVVYKAAVAGRNERRLCGEPDCADAPGGQCSKCEGYFCLRHLAEAEVEHWQGGTAVRVRASLCPHCAKRRRIWERR